ncbi:hypothetical protein [Cellulomonas cellasea]|uniref:Uncharacterized protein n=2 Tax=Cellulomonas cellasea TaxID=43670 RepID=A0A0A0B7H2_9CELL|nr:hypothetical protein [Cellulomonas cellasea]KGM02112.1 hypothetical protein Q760_15355 [Cellulomonas cellasea DSM 20118]GEA89831.1 hypothetical protein CCE01nite_37800 [Cellulomonas cellasea]
MSMQAVRAQILGGSTTRATTSGTDLGAASRWRTGLGWCVVAVVAVGTGYAVTTSPLLAGAALAAAAAVILVVRAASPAPVFLLTYLALVLLPVLPGFQQRSALQLAALVGVAALGYAGLLRIAHARGVSVGVGGWVVAVPVALGAVTVLLMQRDVPRFALGALMAVNLGVGVLAGRITTAEERRSILVGLTGFAQAMAVIALYEAATGAPLYEFTPFQVHENWQVVFRASALLGHPLILAALLVAVAAAHLVRTDVRPAWNVRSRLWTVGLPLAGAVATSSRSAILMIVLAVAAVLLVRRSRDGRYGRGVAALALTATGAVLLMSLRDPTSALGKRLAELSASAEAVRISGLEVVRSITTGVEVVVGGGFGSVPAEASTGATAAVFGTVDNQFLTAYADFGLVGAVGLVLMVATVLLSIRRPGYGPATRMVFVGAVPIIVAMAFCDALAWPALSMIFAYALGVASVPDVPAAADERPEEGAARTRAAAPSAPVTTT